MPKGNPSAQTIASEKYQKKAGYMAKSFKLKRDILIDKLYPLSSPVFDWIFYFSRLTSISISSSRNSFFPGRE